MAAFAVGVRNFFAGGGSSLSFTAQVFVGVPPIVANATNVTSAPWREVQLAWVACWISNPSCARCLSAVWCAKWPSVAAVAWLRWGVIGVFLVMTALLFDRSR